MALAEVAGEPVLDERVVAARDALARARQRTTPLVLAADRALPVLDPLRPLLPDGLRRGSVVAASGPGATTLAVALAVAASDAGGWTAVVGAPALGLEAVLDLGVAGERLLVIPPPPEPQWATVVAALVEAVDVVLVDAPRVAPGAARRLTARARERGAVLVTLPGSRWAAADVRLTVESVAWVGVDGDGAGRLVARRAEVSTAGRGAAARRRTARLWLPAPDGRVAAVDR